MAILHGERAARCVLGKNILFIGVIRRFETETETTNEPCYLHVITPTVPAIEELLSRNNLSSLSQGCHIIVSDCEPSNDLNAIITRAAANNAVQNRTRLHGQSEERKQNS